MPEKKLHRFISLVFLLFSTPVIASPVSTETVQVPIKLDYPVLRQLMQSKLFNAADNSVEILHDADGCSNIFLSDPRLREYQKKLEITTHVKASIATAVFGNCTHLFNWEGDARFLTEPVIQPGARSVRQKIAFALLYGDTGFTGDPESGRPAAEMNVTRFASYIGCTREAVSRALSGMETETLMERRNGVLTSLDRTGLDNLLSDIGDAGKNPPPLGARRT